jgi:lysine 2,3-aminomutase
VTAYLRSNPEIREVIFSGGDPLACAADALDRAVTAFRSVPDVRWIRFHTKAPVFSPSILSEAHADLLVRHDVRLVLHVVHPYELTRELEDRLRSLRKRGVLLYNQFPILRGINDHAAVVLELLRRLADVGVHTMAIYVPEPVRDGAVYRVRLDRVFAITDEVFRTGEGWVSGFRVCLDTPIGKVRREDIVLRDPARDTVVFEREGRRVEFRDIPAGMDVPTPLSDLLYR